MKNTPERFNRAINALVTAFFNETLAKGTCAACAVGNIVAHAYGQKINDINKATVDCDGISNQAWKRLFMTNSSNKQSLYPFGTDDKFIEEALSLISKTDYNMFELAKVEYAFEINTNMWFNTYKCYTKEQIMEDQYKGLMAVVDVLCELDGIEEPNIYKELFNYSI